MLHSQGPRTLWLAARCRWCPDLRAVKLHTADPDERKRLRKEVRLLLPAPPPACSLQPAACSLRALAL
jgi:hypothetical protein